MESSDQLMCDDRWQNIEHNTKTENNEKIKVMEEEYLRSILVTA
jgi:hypothetical protein